MITRMLRRRFHYGWVVVAVTFLAMLAASAIRSTPSVLMLPLEHEFHWDRPTLSLAVSINLFLFGFSGPFAAAVMERVGMRNILMGALTTLAVALGVTTRMTAVWQLHLLWGVVVGLGTGALSGWVTATVSSRWFTQRRGVVVGVLTTANAAGQLVFLPLLAAVAASVGWRLSTMVGVAAAAVAVPLVAIFIRGYPHEVGLRPYGASADEVVALPQPPAENPFAAAMRTLAKALRNRDFLLLSGTFFICGASTNGLIGTHMIPASVEHGMAEVAAAGLLAAIGAFNVVGSLASGWLSDRFDNRRLLAWYYGLRGLSLLFLPYAYQAGYSALALFAIFYGLDWVATVPPTMRLASDLFGKEHAGSVFAWVFAAHQAGAASIAFGAGELRHWLGDYQVAFMLSGALCLVATVMALRIGPPVREIREAVTAD